MSKFLRALIKLAPFNVIIYFNHLKPICNRHESILSTQELAHGTSYVKRFQQAGSPSSLLPATVQGFSSNKDASLRGQGEPNKDPSPITETLSRPEILSGCFRR